VTLKIAIILVFVAGGVESTAQNRVNLQNRSNEAGSEPYIISLRRVYATIVAVENNKYILSVLAGFGIHYAMRMRHSVVCGPSGCTVIFHIYLINGAIFEKKSY
jgi:hypothetical protein